MEDETMQPGASNAGHLIGVPGPHVENVGVLDLRTCTLEELSQLKSLRNIGTVLVSSAIRGGLSGVSSENVGSFIEADPDERLLVGPMLELDGLALEAMEEGQKLIVVGILWFTDTVTVEQVQKKLSRLRLTGILLAPQAVRGALLARIEHIGPIVTLPVGVKNVIKEIGQKTITAGYLRHVKDDNLYVNIGQTIFAEDVPLELVQQKISAYINIGQTVAPRGLLDYLDARCEANLGNFATPETEGE
ncbi:hypothetical protein [Armatimonas rosea]|uniref:Uncharacterized protein n=1 Tax=Armatimonas rosea TaxID=685828 RepID=A0A7W9SRV7_ARMRO|nr:hypothetical protein [Armatimonas rosea]MBB6051576.1 hypothetical protein [Armatimonas rosea]